MAQSRVVFHTSDLYRLIRPWNPSIWGENVGMAGTVRRVHRMFMRSAAHRGNIFKARFSKIGIGVIERGGRVWATVIFYGR